MEPEKPHQPEDQQPQEIQQPAQPPEALLPGITVQMRAALSNLHLAALQLAPPAKRDEDPELDQRAAVLDQSYYRLLRLVNNLTAAQIFRRRGRCLFGIWTSCRWWETCATRRRAWRGCWD